MLRCRIWFSATQLLISFIHSFIPLFSVDLLQDAEIVMFLKVQEREGDTVAYSTYM